MLSNERVHELLEKTSRTFALCIPLLDEPLRRQVGLAYLLFRIADTYEDAVLWSKQERLEALALFARWLRGEGSPEERQDLQARPKRKKPLEDAGYLELLEDIAGVMESLEGLPSKVQEIIKRYTLETTVGMLGIVEQANEDGSLYLSDLPALRSYCYIVAGLVGEMLTELFCAEEPRLAEAYLELLPGARWFGEALQLVNILKDVTADASEGRSFLPPEVPKEIVFAYAREDIEEAIRYIGRLEASGASAGILRFTGVPLRLAIEALEVLKACGPAAKVRKDKVFGLIAQVCEATEGGRGLRALLSEASVETPSLAGLAL